MSEPSPHKSSPNWSIACITCGEAIKSPEYELKRPTRCLPCVAKHFLQIAIPGGWRIVKNPNPPPRRLKTPPGFTRFLDG